MKRFASQYEAELAIKVLGLRGCAAIPPAEPVSPYDVSRYLQSLLVGWAIISSEGLDVTAEALEDYEVYLGAVRQKLTDTLVIMADTVRDGGFGALYKDTHG